MADPTVAKYTVASAVTAVRSATAHDNDRQVTDDQIKDELDQEYRALRRYLSQFVPELYQGVAPFTLTSPAIVQPANCLAKPVDFERLTRLEVMFSQGCWEPVAVRPMIARSQGIAVDVAGQYRLTYVQRPVDGYDEYDLPEGANRILVHKVAAWVRQRFEEDPSYHEQKAEQLKAELRRDLVIGRYGAHPVSGLQHGIMGYGYRSAYEEGDHFVIV